MTDRDHPLAADTQRWERRPELGGPPVPRRPPVPPPSRPGPVAAPHPDATGRDVTVRDDTGQDALGLDDMGWDETGQDDALAVEPHRPDDRHPAREPLWQRVARGTGELLVTAGLVLLLFVVYEVYVTDLLTDRKQDQLAEELQQVWDEPAAPAEQLVAPAVGEPLAVLHVPRLGEDWSRVVLEGTAEEQLSQGPSHYVGTALPGQPGNLALAGHRVGKGSPFLDVDQLVAGDPVVVETAGAWYVYRVLGAGDPNGVPGQQIVRPEDVSVIAPTPGAVDSAATGSYLTLTTCHPKYSARQRLIVHAVLDGEPVSKADAPAGPPALEEG